MPDNAHKVMQRRKFGALAVGRLVQFFEYCETTDGGIALGGDETLYYVDLQCQTITSKLAYVRANC